MKKTRIASTISIGIALIIQMLPIGIIMSWHETFEKAVTYHSYFDLLVWRYGDVGPFLCAMLTTVALCMALAFHFVKPIKSDERFSLLIALVCFVSVIFSLLPTFYGSYSIFGVIITVCLSVATELNFMQFINRKK